MTEREQQMQKLNSLYETIKKADCLRIGPNNGAYTALRRFYAVANFKTVKTTIFTAWGDALA